MRFPHPILSLALILGAGPAMAETFDCGAAAHRAVALEGDIAALDALFARADAACAERFAGPIGDRLGLAHFNAARGTDDPAARKGHLRAAVTTQRTQKWAPLFMLGDMHERDREWADAALRYQEALIWIQEHEDASANPDQIKSLLNRANATRALAPSTRAMRTRSGAPGGIAARSIGGVQITEVPFPIEFEYDSARITEDGRIAAQDLAEIVTAQGAQRITLVGHTDPRGPNDYNFDLAKRRAESVAQFLYAQGVTAKVEVRSAGEEQPPVIDDPSLYSEDETHQIMRRVVLERVN